MLTMFLLLEMVSKMTKNAYFIGISLIAGFIGVTYFMAPNFAEFVQRSYFHATGVISFIIYLKANSIKLE